MRRRIWVAALLPALLLAGCRSTALPYGREIEHMALMRTMGVDSAQDGVTVTVSSQAQDGGRDQGSQPPVVLSQSSGTISGALLAMQADGASYVFYGHVGQLLLGETLARQSVRPALDYVLRDIEMRLDTSLYLVQGEAGPAVSAPAMAGAEDGKAPSSAAEQLEAMEADAQLRSYATPRTVGEVLSELEERGASYAPALALTDEKEGTLMAAGYGILKDGVLQEWTDDEQAHGINLLEGQVNADVVELSMSSGEKVALRVVGATTRVTPVMNGEVLTGLRIVCDVEANLAEGPARLGPSKADTLTALEEALAQVEAARIRGALSLAQALDADYLGLEKRAGLAAPWHWDAIQRGWDMAQMDMDLTVQAHIERGYDVDQ